MSKLIVENKPDEALSLAVDWGKYGYLMAVTPLQPKGQPRHLQRLIRIKRNLLRELEAFNKEIKRVKP